MTLTFYPYAEDAQKGSLSERTETLMEAAERFKAIVLDTKTADSTAKRAMPREQVIAYNWEEIARLLREVKELPESSKLDKLGKADLLAKLAEVYEVLRAAKMPKLEAVRLALINEANQLRTAASQMP